MKISEATLCPSFFLNKVKNMENISLLESFSEFKDEKLIDRVTLALDILQMNEPPVINENCNDCAFFKKQSQLII